MKTALMTLVIALSLTTIAANADTLPKSYRGDWCLDVRIKNGHDVITGKRIPNDVFYRRRDKVTDCEDFILIGAKRYGECRILRVSKVQDGHRVTYNCGDGRARMTIHRDDDKLVIEE